MPKPAPPARPTAQRQKPNAAAATPARAEPRPNPKPMVLSSGDAKLMVAVLREMLKH